MRIAILSDTVFPTPMANGHGLGRAVFNAASQLVKREHEVTLFGLTGSTLPGGFVITTPIGPLEGERVLANEIIKMLKYFDVALDAGHLHTLARRDELPTVAWFHDIKSAKAQNAIFPSEFCRDEIDIPGPIIHNGVDPLEYPLYTGERGPWVMFLGSNDPHKGLADAQQAAEIAKRELRAHGKGCPDGPISGVAKTRVLQHAAAVLCPYHVDAGAHVPLEAMMCGTPVIARAAGCMIEYVPSISGAMGGILAESPLSMAAIIPFIEEIAGAGVRKAVIDAGFTVRRLGAEIEDVLERVLNGERW